MDAPAGPHYWTLPLVTRVIDAVQTGSSGKSARRVMAVAIVVVGTISVQVWEPCDT